MQELIWLLEPVGVWLDGGSMKEIAATEGFLMLALLGAVLAPSTLIAWGIGASDWRETPLARYFGAGEDPDEGWAERARDLDKDGLPDF